MNDLAERFDGTLSADELADDGAVVAARELADDMTALAHLAETEPGPFAMMILRGIDPNTLDIHGKVEYARLWERQISWVAAAGQGALAAIVTEPMPVEVAGRHGLVMEELDWRADLVAASLHWSTATSAHRLDQARRLVADLPGTHALLSAGEISIRHAFVMNEATDGLDPATVALVEARVLKRAPHQTPAELGRSVRRAIIAVAPEVVQLKHEQAIADRNVRLRPDIDGMAALIATMSAVDAETVHLALDSTARKMAAADGDKTIPLAARRVDVLVAWALAALADPDLPKQHGRPVQVRLTMDLPTALGLADNPAELAHYGTIPGYLARRLAADADWIRFVTDPVTGALLDYGHTVYRPPQALADYVIARDRVCVFPGCSMAAERCDIDHGCPYEKGGHTSACNCHSLCRRHHLLKTVGGWQLLCHGDGAVTWIAPTGQQFYVPVPNLDPDLWPDE
jgi:Domain of unknown function (DUF222)